MTIPENNLLIKEIDGKRQLAVSYSQIEEFQNCPYRWHKDYVLGERVFSKSEATAYGSAIHETLEWFFKNGCRPRGQEIANAYEYFAINQDIPFSSPASMMTATKQALETWVWIRGLFQKKIDGSFARKDLNPFERDLRESRVVGIEEPFCLPYRLKKPVEINGEVFTHVYINGFIDLHLENEKGHIIVDWKSGAHLFDEEKIATNLQHPIYSFYTMRAYKTGFPHGNYYFFTRTREYQRVKMDKARQDLSISILNNVFDGMYDFESKEEREFKIHDKKGPKDFRYAKARTTKKVLAQEVPSPSPFCYNCSFSATNGDGSCKYSSLWTPSDKKEKCEKYFSKAFAKR